MAHPVLSFEVLGNDPEALRTFYKALCGRRFREAAGRGSLSGFATFKVATQPPAVVPRELGTSV
jgi:hypothetical protein